MNISNLGLFYSIILIICITLDTIKASDIAAVEIANQQYNQAIDNAVESALFDEVEVDDREAPFWNHDVVVHELFENLYINLGIMESPKEKILCRLYMPVILIIDTDNVSIYGQSAEWKDNNAEIGFCEKRNFYYECNTYALYFTLGQYVKFMNEENGVKAEGYYSDIKNSIPDELQWNQEEFEEIRQNTIIEVLETAANDYMNHHNKIAVHYGITYYFKLPVIDKEDWYRTIRDRSIVVFFQGYPLGNSISGRYNRIAIGAARMKKN